MNTNELLGDDASAVSVDCVTVPKPIAKIDTPDDLIDVATGTGLEPTVCSPSVSSTITRGSPLVLDCSMLAPLESPAAMFVPPDAVYELSELDSVVYDEVSELSVDAELLNTTAPADEPPGCRPSRVARLRTNERTPPTCALIEPLPSSTNATSARVEHTPPPGGDGDGGGGNEASGGGGLGRGGGGG